MSFSHYTNTLILLLLPYCKYSNNGLILIRSSVNSLSLHTMASMSPTFALIFVSVICPFFPKTIWVECPRLVAKSCDFTVDSRSMMASAPESKRASVATLAANDEGADPESQL